MSQPLLSIQNLQVNFLNDGDSFTAVKNINIDVQQKEVVAIVGESGSGKSVTSLSILKLLPTPPAQYVSGKILFTGKQGNIINLLETNANHLKQIRGNEISMIFQEPMSSLNPVQTCGKQVMEAVMLHQRASNIHSRKKTIDLFNQVELPDPVSFFNRYPHQISGGQKQRVMIAMAISCNPALLICDEPTTALDVTVQKKILLLIKQLQLQQNMGVIFITHDLGVVEEIADKVVVMYKGSIVEQGTAEKIYNYPSHPYTRALLACRPLRHRKGEKLPVVSDFMVEDKWGTIIEKTPPQKLINEENRLSSYTSDPLLQNDSILTIENLSVWYPVKRKLFGIPGFVKAVDDVTFNVYKGETLGLVGESGCGKTTLGRAILRLINSTSGQIFFRGKDLASASGKEMKELRKEIQIIFQDPFSSLNPRMTVGEAISEPLRVHKIGKNERERKEMVLSLLEKVNLSKDFYNRYPHEFSGGQRQRIVIARALALKPAFLICDESVSALDVSVQAQVLNLLNQLKSEFNFSSIFISHDLSVVGYLSDRILVMNKGKLEEIGSAEQVYFRPKSAYTKQLIAAIPKGRIK